MFEKPDDKPNLQTTIDELIAEMRSVNADSEEYCKMADQLEKIYKLKEVDFKRKIDLNQLIAAFVSAFAIVRITKYERENVVTSKVLNLINPFKP